MADGGIQSTFLGSLSWWCACGAQGSVPSPPPAESKRRTA